MTFPEKKHDNLREFSEAYFKQLAKASASIDCSQLEKAADLLLKSYENNNDVYVCGNGGSAAISNHFVCDHGKLLATNTALLPRVHSLSTNIEVITAIANDISYDDIFAHQLKLLAKPGDVVVTVSSSGDSENVVRAAKWSRKLGLDVISMTGFSGGRTAEVSSVNIHVDGDNYGVIEDTHHSIMHILGQFLRLSAMDEDIIKKTKF